MKRVGNMGKKGKGNKIISRGDESPFAHLGYSDYLDVE